MSRHSRNLKSFFTNDEKKKLNYGTEKVRLSKDSLRKYNACFLCLSEARDPSKTALYDITLLFLSHIRPPPNIVICEEGHVSCKACILESIVNQKQEISNYEKALLLQKQSESLADKRTEEEARNLLVQDFLSSQKLIDISGGKRILSAGTGEESESGSVKKIRIEKSDPDNLADKREDASSLELAKKQIISAESSSSSKKDALPSFWIPSLAPTEKSTKLKDEKKQVVCTAGIPHPLRQVLIVESYCMTLIILNSLKKLTVVKFTCHASEDGGDSSSNICKGCLKELSNSMKIIVLKKCGHVFCSKCCDMLCQEACYICCTKVKSSVKSFIEIKHEGTGFAVKGKVEAQVYRPAFQ